MHDWLRYCCWSISSLYAVLRKSSAVHVHTKLRPAVHYFKTPVSRIGELHLQQAHKRSQSAWHYSQGVRCNGCILIAGALHNTAS